jgi:hypothetical protein
MHKAIVRPDHMLDCTKCPMIAHCKKAVKIGLWVACEDADNDDIRRMQDGALALLKERMAWEAV